MTKTIKQILAIILTFIMIVSTMPVAFAADTQENIVILYTNDVHGSIDDYAKLAAYKAELIAEGNTVITVDAGDAIRSDTICSKAVGEAVVDIMNAVGYDYAVPGNHEYDYGIDVFLDLAEAKANFEYTSSNFYYLSSVSPVFEPYYIENVGDYQIAFVGISTPETANVSPEHFKDENGNFIYGFPKYPSGMTNEILYETVQESVDDAKTKGADIVVAIGHTGIAETTDGWKTSDIIANTSGIDYFIDGHSHETVEEELYQNKIEEDVVRTSTGSNFANFGAITIHSDGNVDFELINPDTINVDAMSEDAKTAYNTVKEKIDYYNDEFDALSHDYETVVTAPNCTEDGYTTYTCPICGDTYTDDETDALGHDYDDGVVTGPTCTEGGYTTYTCIVCGDTYTDDGTDALDHDYDDGVTTEPTCTENGYITYTCTVCEAWYTENYADPLGHQIGDDGLCGECGTECTHTDEDFNEKCDACEAILDYEEVQVEETNTVYIPEADKAVIVKFTADGTGEYVIVSDNGGNDDINDPYVSVFNSDGEKIADDDDSDYEDTYNFYCEFEAETGETYYIALYSYDEDVEYDYTIEKHIGIDHQPAPKEPYVTLTWDVPAEYQWYRVEMGDAEATDENAEPYSYDGATATYDSVNGWTSVVDADGYYSSATLELNEGDTVIVEFAEGDFEYCGFWDFNAGHEGDGCDENNGVLTYEFTMDADGVYTLYTNSPVAHKIYVGGVTYTAIDGETDATLKNPEIGTIYACKVTLENGDALTSDILEYTYAIVHQPTSAEPYVELNDDTDATYQWYLAEEGIVELTDENTIAFPSEDEGPIYDAEKGWSGIYIGTAEIYDCYAYFIVPLKAGDTILIELSGGYYGRVELIDVMSGGVYAGEVDEDGKCEFTAKEDSFYAVCAYRDVDGDEVFVKAYMNGYEYTAIDGETDATLQNSEIGTKYACKVTFADDSTEMSDVFEKTNVEDNTGDNTGDNAGGNTGDNLGGNTGDNAGGTTGGVTGDINTNNPDIPPTAATENNGWFAILLTMSMGLALVMTVNKKRVFSR